MLLTRRVKRARLLKSCDFADRLFHTSIIRCEKKYLYSFLLINRLRLWLEFMVLFQHDDLDVLVQLDSSLRNGGLGSNNIILSYLN